MGLAVTNATMLTLTNRATSLEGRMMLISSRRQLLAYQAQAIQEDYQNKLTTLFAAGTTESLDENADFVIAQITYEVSSTQINAKDSLLESEEVNLSTQLRAVEAEKESIKKQLEKQTGSNSTFNLFA